MSPVITERELAAACRETLRQWPQARAAVLFGSRARGTAHPGQRPGMSQSCSRAASCATAPARHGRCFRDRNCQPICRRSTSGLCREEDLHRRSRTLGSLPYIVCRDGRVLAGKWNTPDPEQMEQEVAMNPEDWARRTELVVTKVDAASTQIGKIATSGTWTGSGADCIILLQDSANAAELLVRAAMERRGVPADRSHDIAELASQFAAERPDQTALAQRMAALNGESRAHHMAMYDFQPPEAPDVTGAVRRLGGTLDLWASEIETADDGMAAQLTGLARFAADRASTWPDLVCVQVQPKAEDSHPAQIAAEAALEGRAELAEAIASFRDRIRRVLEGPAPGEDQPSLSPVD